MENKRAKKAYAFTLSVILMSIVIVSLASFASQTLRQSRTDYISLESSESLGFVSDDVTDDIISITGTNLFATRNATLLTLRINDTSPFPKSPATPIYLGSYQNFLQTIYFDKTNAVINISTGTFEQNGVVYAFSNPNGNYAHLQAEGGYDAANLTIADSRGVNLSSASLFVYFCNQTRSSFTQMPSDLGGSIRVSIDYTDLTGTMRQNATIAKGTRRSFTVEYTEIGQTLEYLIDTTGDNTIISTLSVPDSIGCEWSTQYALAYPASGENGPFSAVYPNIAANYSEKNGNYTKKVTNITVGQS